MRRNIDEKMLLHAMIAWISLYMLADIISEKSQPWRIAKIAILLLFTLTRWLAFGATPSEDNDRESEQAPEVDVEMGVPTALGASA